MIARWFTRSELACTHCGSYHFDNGALSQLDSIREACGFPFPVSSGYRCVEHPIEKAKDSPGEHSEGLAADIAVSGQRALIVVGTALRMGVPRIGVNQKGPWEHRYIHLGFSTKRPSSIWSY